MSRLPLLLLLSCSALGCIDTDAAVFVEPSLHDVSAQVTESVLGAGLGGSFRLRLHLGPRANGESEVRLNAFSVTSAERTTNVLPTLEATTTPSFPVTVPVDGDVDVQASFTAEDNMLTDMAALDALCAPEGVRIVAALDGSLRGGGVDAASEPFIPTMCP